MQRYHKTNFKVAAANAGVGVRSYGQPFEEKIKPCVKEKKKVVPVFFAADDNYLPFLDVAILSLKENASRGFSYKLHVLHSGIKRSGAEKIMRHAEEWFSISFVDVSEQLEKTKQFMQLRDYYTSAIYYRLFIVDAFPEYEKALYLDCDTIVLGDISKLYSIELGKNYIGAVADGAVARVTEFQAYTKKALGVDGDKYFNSGVLSINLKALRQIGFYDKFYGLLKSYEFTVAPDQDCLNILCKDKVKYFPEAWNRMPQGVKRGGKAKLIHYNLAQKPWHYDGVLYGEYFWSYAKKSAFYQEILARKNAFTPEQKRRDEEGCERLILLAKKEAESDCNYFKLYGKNRI